MSYGYYGSGLRDFESILRSIDLDARRVLTFGTGVFDKDGYITPTSGEACPVYAHPQPCKNAQGEDCWEQVTVFTGPIGNAAVFFDKKFAYYIHKPSPVFKARLQEYSLPQKSEDWSSLDLETDKFYNEAATEIVEENIYNIKRMTVKRPAKADADKPDEDTEYLAYMHGMGHC
jgi:hypothetical protein